MGPSKGKNIKNTSHEVTKRKIRIRQLSLAKEAREKEKMICVNHVMSNDVYSGIFESILNYFQRLSPPYIKYHVSIKPLKGMHIYHYHRPHIEEKLKPYSIATVHHDLRDSDKWLNNEKFIDRYAESKKVICLNSLQERILHREGINHTVVIPHGYRPDIFALDDVSAKENKKKLVIGFFSKRYGRKVKGEAYLLELIKRLDPGRIKFIFVGEGRSQECWTTRSLGFEAQVYERIPYRLFGDLYRAIDVLLMVSRYEGGPANIPEAVASGTPVVGIPVGLMNDMIEPGVNGIYLTGHPSVDAEEILNLAKPNNLLLSKLKEGAKSCRSKAIPWSETVMRNVAIYREIATELETGDQISDEIKSIALAS